MLIIESKMSMEISGEILKPILTYKTPINALIREWHLDQLETILTVDSLNDDAARKKLLHQKRRNSNMLLGAVAGGIIDADSGDDSIIDGVIVGAAFGAICTPSGQIPKAQIGLLFKNGQYLSAEVDKEEYTQLQTIAASNKLNPTNECGFAFKDRQLSNTEVNFILSGRASNKLMQGVVIAMMTAVTPFFFKILTAIYDMPLPDEVYNAFPLISFFSFFSVSISFYISTTKIESLIECDEEKKFYKSLNG